MRTTNAYLGTPSFVADFGSVRRNTGRQYDWDAVPAAFEDPATGKKHVPAGHPVAAIDATGLIIPLNAAPAAGQTIIGVATSDANEDALAEAKSGHGVITGAVVYEELLPVALDPAVRTALEDLPGGGFAFETYSDNRAS